MTAEVPDFERPGVEYLVRVPAGELPLYRFIRSERPEAGEFRSNRELGKRRRRRLEDSADYLGISCFETLGQATAFAVDLNQRLRLSHTRLTPYTHVAELLIRGAAGHALARTGEIEGHHTVWGEPEELASTIVRVLTIEGGEV